MFNFIDEWYGSLLPEVSDSKESTKIHTSTTKEQTVNEQSTDNYEKVGKVPVADIFYSIQGEGFNVGIPSAFIRFAGCNLQCPWCDSWWAVTSQVLMSVYSNTHDSAKMVMKYMLHKAGIYETGKANIVFTGGEPTLYQNFISNMILSLDELYDELKTDLPTYINTKEEFLHSVTFEMETNGLIYPEKIIDVLINPIIRIQPLNTPRFVFEISPKLVDNIMTDSMKKRVISNLEKFKEIESKTESNISFIVKFVTDGRQEEIEQIEKFIEDSKVSRRKVYLMPKCSLDEKENYIHVARTVANVCMMKHWRFSPREQILLFNKYRSA